MTRAAQIDAVVLEPLSGEALADAELVHEIDGVLLQQAGPYAPLDVLAVAGLQNHGLDSLALQEERKRQSGWPGTDDSDLCAHPVPLARVR